MLRSTRCAARALPCPPPAAKIEASSRGSDRSVSRMTGDLESFTAETFAPHLGEVFRVLVDDGSELVTELVSVEPYEERGAGRRMAFSLVFLGPSEPLLPQRIYRFRHEELGAFDIFVVPIGRDEAGVRYESVFA